MRIRPSRPARSGGKLLISYRWASDVSEYAILDGQTAAGPTYSYEYSTREAYGKTIHWKAHDPLNATWWHLVTEGEHSAG